MMKMKNLNYIFKLRKLPVHSELSAELELKAGTTFSFNAATTKGFSVRFWVAWQLPLLWHGMMLWSGELR